MDILIQLKTCKLFTNHSCNLFKSYIINKNIMRQGLLYCNQDTNFLFINNFEIMTRVYFNRNKTIIFYFHNSTKVSKCLYPLIYFIIRDHKMIQKINIQSSENKLFFNQYFNILFYNQINLLILGDYFK
ncbi:hypothetical protein pb186bvf_000520 [Paramecium bursaria]